MASVSPGDAEHQAPNLMISQRAVRRGSPDACAQSKSRPRIAREARAGLMPRALAVGQHSAIDGDRPSAICLTQCAAHDPLCITHLPLRSAPARRNQSSASAMGTRRKTSTVISLTEPVFSFRDDVTIDTIRDQLAKHSSVRLLDCGCGEGPLPAAMARAGLPVSRIVYHGLDQDERCVKQARAHAHRAGYEKPDVRVRELWDLAGYPPKSFDVIVVNNILHEIPAERLPRLFEQLNSLLARPHGIVCIVDIEALPEEAPLEPWAIMWKAIEAEAVLRAGNWSPQRSTHPKRVTAYKLVFGPTERADLDRMAQSLKTVLDKKRRMLLDEVLRRRASGDTSEEVRRLSSSLTSIIASLHELIRGTEK